jgi:uncharacterized protein YyaL (SSP411 family)
MTELQVLAPGPLATVQDLGRPGHAALGVGASGAVDRASLRLANRLVGNREGAAGLELTLGGLRARFDAPALIALAGAPAEVAALAGVVREEFRPHVVLAGGPGDNETSVPLMEGRTALDGRAAAYVCEHFACRMPVTEPAELEALLTEPN